MPASCFRHDRIWLGAGLGLVLASCGGSSSHRDASGGKGGGTATGGTPTTSPPEDSGETTLGTGGVIGASGGDHDAGSGATVTGGAGGAGGAFADAGREVAADTAHQDGGRDLPNDGGPPKDAAVDAPLPPSSDGGIAVPDGYKLVWSDEFNIDGTPDPRSWSYEKGFVRNNELQWYEPDNASVKGGLLVIEGRKEQVANPNYQAGSSDWKTSRAYASYTSSSMTTSGLQSWQYGRFEMRAKIPTSAGMWPAWWTLGTSGEWPSNGEIDIMEFYKGNVLANVACGTATRWTPKWDSSSTTISSLGTNWSASFHVWRMDWDDQKIDLYLDDKLMNSVALPGMLNPDGTSPFKQKVYMILNLAIGGDNGGDPSSTPFPQQYLVDYVRVFQRL